MLLQIRMEYQEGASGFVYNHTQSLFNHLDKLILWRRN